MIALLMLAAAALGFIDYCDYVTGAPPYGWTDQGSYLKTKLHGSGFRKKNRSYNKEIRKLDKEIEAVNYWLFRQEQFQIEAEISTRELDQHVDCLWEKLSCWMHNKDIVKIENIEDLRGFNIGEFVLYIRPSLYNECDGNILLIEDILPAGIVFSIPLSKLEKVNFADLDPEVKANLYKIINVDIKPRVEMLYKGCGSAASRVQANMQDGAEIMEEMKRRGFA